MSPNFMLWWLPEARLARLRWKGETVQFSAVRNGDENKEKRPKETGVKAMMSLHSASSCCFFLKHLQLHTLSKPPLYTAN